MMRLAFLSPLPPTRSGIADYSALLLPALSRLVAVTAVTNEPGGSLERIPVITIEEYRRRRSDFDVAIYQVGNNPHHEFIYREAMERPGIVVLHDYVLHHLIVEMTLARGDSEGYVDAMRENHGEAGAAWAKGRAAGFEQELGNFLFPASESLVARSLGVIVHNAFAKQQLDSFGTGTPVVVIDHPYSDGPQPTNRDAIRARLGFESHHRVIAMIGFVTAAKRPEVVFAAFAKSQTENPDLRLLVVGQPAPNVDLDAIARRSGLDPQSLVRTGYVAEQELSDYIGAADRIVNLRHPTAGETSGTLIRALAIGRPVAVNDFAQFSELPDNLVVKIPFGDNEQHELARFFLEEGDPDGAAAATKSWLANGATASHVAEKYRVEIERFSDRSRQRAESGSSQGPPGLRVIPLFPSIAVEMTQSPDGSGGTSVQITMTNQGRETVRCLAYGEPVLRFRARALAGRLRVVDAVTFDIGSDLHPDERFTCTVRLRAVGFERLTVSSFLESYPAIEETLLATVEMPGASV